jgi:hypothetical protein
VIKQTSIIIIALLSVSCKTCPKENTHPHCTNKQTEDSLKTKPLSVTSSKFMGKLGLPLGTVVKVEGIFYSGDKTRTKALSGLMLMEISNVAGKPITPPVVLRFSGNKKLFPNPKDGNKFSVYTYETGGYTGIPHKAFQHIPIVTTTSFHFESHLILLK